MNGNRPQKARLTLLAFAFLALVLFGGLFYAVEDNPFRRPALAFSIRFDDVTGVREHSKVYFLGIPVGYVSRLDYEPGTAVPAVKVDVVITRSLPIPATVIASLQPTLLGDATIALGLPDQRPPESPEAGREPAVATLANGTEIRGTRATKLEAILPGFDAALATLESLASSTGRRLSDAGTVLDRSVATFDGLFLQKGSDGRTPVDGLIGTLEELINGPEGKQDESIRHQLEAIVGNLRASSDHLNRLSDLQSKDQGSLGQVLQSFQDTADRFRDDAVAAQKVIAKMARTSDTVTQASQQVNTLAVQATQAVEEFHSRPLHFLTSTHPESKPAATPKH
ncbi:MAG TPA: MlaD family protein [Chthoniobacterales bacterium]